MSIEIRRLTAQEVPAAMNLAYDTFLRFEAPDYGPEGVESFRRTVVENEEFLAKCRSGENRMWGALDGDILAGLYVMRGESHICLVFTHHAYHRQGIATALFHRVIADVRKENPYVKKITLNSSPYGLPFYRHMGLYATDVERTVDGIDLPPWLTIFLNILVPLQNAAAHFFIYRLYIPIATAIMNEKEGCTMKRFAVLLLICLLLLTGCAAQSEHPSEPTGVPETAATEPLVPWISEVGLPWDRAGALMELPLNVPDGLHYTSALEFDGDLLLWSVDNHLEDAQALELCLIDLDTGAVVAETSVIFPETVIPQILGDSIYLCDSLTGQVIQLDKSLETVNSWSADPMEGGWYMGQEQTLYIYNWNGEVHVRNLATGEQAPLLADSPYISYFNVSGSVVAIEYFASDSGARVCAVLDLLTGEMMEQPIRRQFDTVSYSGGTWLCDSYDDLYTCYVGTVEDGFLWAEMGYDLLQLVNEDTILRTKEDGCTLSLHHISGEAIAQCVLTESPYTFQCSNIIPSESFGGYFLTATDYNGAIRLLHWDTGKGDRGEDIPFQPVPEPSEEELMIRQRVDALQSRYGVSIFVGDECRTSFFDYTTQTVTDWSSVSAALDILESALSVYPEGFFRLLRYDTIHAIEIHLVGTLEPYDSEEYVDTYVAFVQEEYDRFVMALDIHLSSEQTYYHEFSHIIDAYLAWDALVRPEAIFSEDGWCSLNPGWFPGYTYTYSQEVYLEDYTSFVDGYSTIKPTEDRARVLEYAMLEYGIYTFEDCDILLDKLSYYCSCIRDAFDTSGWPDELPWEQFLYLID